MLRRMTGIAVLALIGVAVVCGPTQALEPVSWVFENVAALVPPPNCGITAYMTGLGFDPQNRAVAGWYGTYGCGGASGPRWGRKEQGVWATHQIVNTNSNATITRGHPDLTLAADGTPFYAYASITPYYIYDNFLWWGVTVANLSANPTSSTNWVRLIQYQQNCISFYPRFALAFSPVANTPSVLTGTVCDYGAWLTLDPSPGTLHGAPIFSTPAGTGANFLNIDHAVGPAGQRHVAYFYERGIKGWGVAYNNGTPAHEVQIVRPHRNRGAEVSVEADSNNRIHLAIGGIPTCSNTFEGGLLYAASADGGVTWQKTFVDIIGGRNPSIALDAGGNPTISYYRGAELRLARKTAEGWTTERVKSHSVTPDGQSSRLAFDRNGNPNVLFYDKSTQFVSLAQGPQQGPALTLLNPGDQVSASGSAPALQLWVTGAATPSFAATCLPTGLSINSTTGAITGTITATQGSTFQPTITVTDAEGSTATVNFTWKINSNSAPAITNPGNQATAEGTSPSLRIVASDPDGDSLTYSSTGLPAGLAINASTGIISGTLGFATAGLYNASVTAIDGKGGSASASFTWTVTDVNRAPSLTNPGNQVSPEGSTPSLQISANDADGDALIYNASGLPPGLAINTSTGLINGNLSFSSAGSYNPVVSVDDGKDGSASATFTWTVSDVNRAPGIANPANQVSPEGSTPSLQITANDADGDALIYNASGLPPGLAINTSTGLINGNLSFSSAGSYNPVVSVNDGKGGSASATFTWTVSKVNRSPVCSVARPSLTEIWPPNHTMVTPVDVLGVTDPDGDRISITIARILQDEPTDTLGDGAFAVDGFGVGTARASVRAERSGTPRVPGNGRVYEILFSAADTAGGSCQGSVIVSVPHDKGRGPAVDDGIRYDSSIANGPRVR